MRIRRFVLLVLVSVLAVVLTSCGGSATGGGSSFSYSGTWVGTIADSVAGPGTVTATMSQSGSNLVGTWQSTFAAGSNGGTLAGQVRTNDVLIELYPSNPMYCPYAVVGNRSGGTLSGTYAAFNCSMVITGTLNITKQ